MSVRPEEMRVAEFDRGKVLLIPPMEPMGARLFAAAFRHAGFDARVLREDGQTLALGLKHTAGGECAPCPTTLGSLLHAFEGPGAPDPDRTLFFMPTACGPCRFGQYTQLGRLVLEKLGLGGVRMVAPSAENAYAGMDLDSRQRLWHAVVASDVARKLVHRVRPYETEPGSVDGLAEELLAQWEKDLAGSPTDAMYATLERFARRFESLPRAGKPRPVVGVVGEIYVRANPFLNQDLCRRIESLGGEAWLAPLSEWVLYTSHIRALYARRDRFSPAALVERARTWLEENLFFVRVEHRYYDSAGPALADRREPDIDAVMKAGGAYAPWEFEGESLLTLGRTALFFARDGVRAVVNAAPMFCMPGTITTSIFPRLEKEFGRPVVCNFYDGSGDPNQSLVPMMHYFTHHETESEA